MLLVNIGQLVTMRAFSSGPRRGLQLKELGMVRGGAVLCAGGRIVSVGETRDALRDRWLGAHRRNLLEIDCRNKLVVPGFVDSHTHPAFVGPRLLDFEQRIAGATYEQIARSGGGIRSSVQPVRDCTQSELSSRILARLDRMASLGTTTVEAKSGYGLSSESELKSLTAIGTARARWPGTLVPTLLGAHVVPPEYEGRSREYVKTVCTEMVPRAARRHLARFVDVFCDRGAFSAEETAEIFQAAREQGLEVKAHVGQLSRTEIKPLLRFSPASLDHMDHVESDDMRFLAKSDTVATLVPGANYFLASAYPPARQLIEAGVAVALATDYNPGSSPIQSMPFVLSLACTQMRMSPAEALAAATTNGAWALRLGERKGSIEPGKDADLALFDVPDYRELAYWAGSNYCLLTVLGGELRNRDTSGELCRV